MKTKDILELDYRIEKNKDKIQKILRQVKPLAKFSEDEVIPLEVLEKCLFKICNKYKISCFNISSDFNSNDFTIWRMQLIYKNKSLPSIYGSCIYEMLAKAIILSYSEIKK